QAEVPGVDRAGQVGEGVVVVVACDGVDRDPGVRKALQAPLQRAECFEPAVVVVDEVTTQRDEVHPLTDGALDEPHPGFGARPGGAVAVPRHSTGTTPEVQIPGAEDTHVSPKPKKRIPAAPDVGRRVPGGS